MKVGQHLPKSEYESDQYDITPKNVKYTFRRGHCDHPTTFNFYAMDRRSDNMQSWYGKACTRCSLILEVQKLD